MPAKCEASHPVVCSLIRWLLAANPAERPTALEVQRSELLPPQASWGVRTYPWHAQCPAVRQAWLLRREAASPGHSRSCASK